MEAYTRIGSKLFFVTVTLALLSGCSDGPGGNEHQTEGSGSVFQQSEKAHANADQRDVNKWRPTTIVALPPVSSEEKYQSRLDLVKQTAAAIGLPEPESVAGLPPVIREVTLAESGEVHAKCMTEKGFPATSVGGSVVQESVAEDQKELAGKAMLECVSTYPIDARYARKPTREQWQVRYEYLTQYYIPCVESFGVKIPTDSIPSKEVYVEGALSGGQAWHPMRTWVRQPEYREQADDSTPTGAQLAEACRQGPPDWAFFGK